MTGAVRRQYANDGSLESVEAMLQKMAGIFYARTLAMGLPMEFEDVRQELMLAYVKAKQKWNPERANGAKFSTYCHTVARNEFNSRIARMALDREQLGLISIDAMAVGDDEEGNDGYERAIDESSEDQSPEDCMLRRQELSDRLSHLSPHARALVAHLIRDEMQGQGVLTLGDIADNLKMSPAQKHAVREEIKRVFGIEVTLIRSRRRAAPATAIG